MPVELTIVETVTTLDTTVVEVILESASTPGPAGVGVPAGGTDGQVLTKQSATDYDTDWETPGGTFAPNDVDYIVGTASGALTSEIVAGTAPGGELGGTWAAPTVDAVHSGSSHAAIQAAAEATAAAALSAHEADTTGVHGIADTAALALTVNHPSNATFNDHSARHENGGADEISLAGLDGTPTELSNHLADATDAHDASAISVVPFGSIAASDVQAALEEIVSEASGGAPTGADYLVGTAQGGLSAEIVVGTTPGGELGGSWASPTVDATHSGSSHASVQAAAEATAQAALDAHTGDTTDAHDASAISVDSTSLSGTAAHVQGSLEELDNLLDDHSSRHEDGGADEISIQGLSGTPAALQTHLDDTSDAHDASAISFSATGGIASTEVQAAIAELDTEKTTAAAALSAAQTEIADQRRAMVILVTAQDGTAITTGDGKAYVGVPDLIDGHNLVSANAQLVGQSSSGQVDVQIHNVTQAADMLSTKITIQANESHSKDGTPGVPDTNNDDVAYGDLLRVDIDAAGTGADGLIVVLEFEAP